MASIENSSPGYVSWVDILLNIFDVDVNIIDVNGKNDMIVRLMSDFNIDDAENMDKTSPMWYSYPLQVDALDCELMDVFSKFPLGHHMDRSSGKE